MHRIKEMVSYYKDIEPSEVPAFIIFITDGENWDTNETNKIVKELSNLQYVCTVLLELEMKVLIIFDL